MLGLIVVAADEGDGLSSFAVLEDLLGVPVLARAIAAALPPDESVTGVLVVPAEMTERVQTAIIERFGFDEIDRVVAGGADPVAALAAGLEALPDDTDCVIVQNASQALAPTGLVEAVVKAARASSQAAAPAVEVAGHIAVVDGETLAAPSQRASLRRVQGPQAFMVPTLNAALSSVAGEDVAAQDPAAWVLQAGGQVTLTEGDADNILLRDAADMGRAVEVFSRRAVDFAFVYPRDLLPEDPLAEALASQEPVSEANGQTEHASE